MALVGVAALPLHGAAPTGIIGLTQGAAALKGLWGAYRRLWKFWTTTGTIGFGVFYALICFSADYSPAWVIAATWQSTIVASLVVLMGFGRRFCGAELARRAGGLFWVILVNASHIDHFDLGALLRGGGPVLLAAFCYPLGNQLVWEARHGHPKLPALHGPLLDNALNRVWLLSVGSLPLWGLLVAAIRPPMPEPSQVANTLIVALLSGVIATSIFLHARHVAANSAQLAAVDATQASEVVFALLGGILLLGSSLPTPSAWLGLALIVAGLWLFAASDQDAQPLPAPKPA